MLYKGLRRCKLMLLLCYVYMTHHHSNWEYGFIYCTLFL